MKLSGKGPDLEQVARLGGLFGVNENIESVLLTGVSKRTRAQLLVLRVKLIFRKL